MARLSDNRAWMQAGLLFVVVTVVLSLLLRSNAPSVVPITVENVDELHQVLRLGDGQVTIGAWSPDGSVLALAGSVGVWLYDADNLARAPRLLDEAGYVWDVAFSPDGRLLASGGLDGRVQVWDVATWSQVAVFEDNESYARFSNVVFSPDGRYLVGTLSHTGVLESSLVLWDVLNLREIGRLEGHQRDINAIAFSPDSQLLASMDTDGVRVWDVPNAQLLYTLQAQPIYNTDTLSFSGDGEYLIAGQIIPGISRANVWHIISADEFTLLPFEQVEAIGLSNAIIAYQNHVGASTFFEQTVGFDTDVFQEWAGIQRRSSASYSPDAIPIISPDGEYVLLQKSVGQWEVWRIEGTREAVLHREVESLFGAYFSQRANSVVATSSYSTQLWNLNTGQHTALDLGQAGGYVSLVYFDERNQPLALFGNWTGSLSVLDLHDGSTISVMNDLVIQNSLVISPDMRYLATNGQDYATLIWDLETGTLVSHFSANNPDAMFTPLAFSPDDRLIAVASREESCDCRLIMLFDVQTGAYVTTLGEVYRYARTGVFSPDGQLFIAGGSGHAPDSFGGSITVWDVLTGEQVAYFDGPSFGIDRLLMSPDGRMVAGMTITDVWLWDIFAPAERAVRMSLVPDGEFDAYMSVAFNPHGDLLAVGTSWGKIQLYVVATGELVGSLSAHNRRVTSLQFSDDGMTLISTGEDGTVRLWRTDDALLPVHDVESISLPTLAITTTPLPIMPTITPTVAPIGN